jgi:L-alanine-DL-glutamate epimerase-like enolase superfamily enzyme
MSEHNRIVSAEELNRAAQSRVLQLDESLPALVIESIRLLRRESEYFVHVRSKEGAEGISVANGQADMLYPILKQRIIPFFIGRDARNLEDDLFELYRYKSNYKLQGLAFWCPVAWVEFALLDMIGRVM